MYKYSLDKSSKKFVCPSCGKKSFVKYINVEDNSYLEEKYGRCDRESSCKFRQHPKQNSVISDFAKPIVMREASTFQSELLILCSRDFKQNNLIQFLKIYFSEEEIQSVIQKYRIGTSRYWAGSTVFWQISPQNKIMAGKVMLFDVETGKRVKVPHNHIQWVHKLLN